MGCATAQFGLSAGWVTCHFRFSSGHHCGEVSRGRNGHGHSSLKTPPRKDGHPKDEGHNPPSP
eukprot:6743433-Alexandrium_andersonii.AAC.1